MRKSGSRVAVRPAATTALSPGPRAVRGSGGRTGGGARTVAKVAVLGIALVLTAGCYGEPKKPLPLPGSHGHTHEAPRGGVLVVLGDTAAHIEVLHDAWKGRIDVYFLGPHAAEAMRIAQETLEIDVTVDGKSFPLTLTPVINPVVGDLKGACSRFAGADERLVRVQRFEGVVRSVKSVAGEFGNVRFGYPSE